MNDKPYRLPDPEKQPESFLVILYKTLKRIEYNDRAWDRIYFPRCMKRTKELLEIMQGNVHLAAQCLKELKDRFEGDGLSWTIETIIQYSFEWRSEHNHVSERDCLRGLVKAYADLADLSWLKTPEQITPALRSPDPAISPSEQEEAAQFFRSERESLAKLPA
jgi:hypothetical protein